MNSKCWDRALVGDFDPQSLKVLKNLHVVEVFILEKNAICRLQVYNVSTCWFYRYREGHKMCYVSDSRGRERPRRYWRYDISDYTRDLRSTTHLQRSYVPSILQLYRMTLHDDNESFTVDTSYVSMLFHTASGPLLRSCSARKKIEATQSHVTATTSLEKLSTSRFCA